MALMGISFIFLIFIVARFAYLPYVDEGRDIAGNFFGFQWISAFLYALGVELAMFCLGLIMLISTNFMLDGAKAYFRSISVVIISISLYFVCWVFYGELAMSLALEVVLCILTSLMLTFALTRLIGYIKAFHVRHKAIISDMLDDLIESAPRYMSEKDVERYDEEVVYPRIKKVSDELHR